MLHPTRAVLCGLGLLAVGAAACGGNTSPTVSTTASTTTSAPGATSTTGMANMPGMTSAGGGGGMVHTATIVIKNFTFVPMTTTVSPGATVTVKNEDTTTHTLTATGAGKAFDTGDIAGGSSKTFTAPSTAGSYPFICNIHQYMHGMLTVS